MSGDPGERARRGRATSMRPGLPPRQPASPRMLYPLRPRYTVVFPARAVPAGLLDPRAPPYPDPVPGPSGPLPPWRFGSIQTVLPSPMPRSLRGLRSLPGAAGAAAFLAPPPPLRARAGGRVGFSPILTKQRSRHRRHRARVRLVRAPASAAPPLRLPRPRCARTHRLPSPPPTASPASAARLVSCARSPALPLSLRMRIRSSPGKVGADRKNTPHGRTTHLCPGRICVCAQGSPSSARRSSPRRRACAERALLRLWWRWRLVFGGWDGEAVMFTGKGSPSGFKSRHEDLRSSVRLD